jgi:hypothetical protein
VPRRFYVQLRECDLVVLVIPPTIAWEVSRMLKITAQAGATIPLRHDEFCEYRVHMEWFQGKLFVACCVLNDQPVGNPKRKV